MGYLSHLTFMYFCRQPCLREYLHQITGIDPVGINSYQVRITRAGDYVRPHTDYAKPRPDGTEERKMCLILYTGRHWQASDDGLFRQFNPDGTSRTMEPIPNRLVLFRTTPQSLHEVEKLSPTAGPRWAYTVWMGPK